MNIEKIDPDAGPLGTQPQVLANQANVARTSDKQWTQLRATRDGSPIVFPWLQALVLEGFVWQVSVGSGTTPVGDGTTWAIARPMLSVGTPAGTAVMPLSVYVSALNQLIAADSDEIDIIVGVDRLSMVTGGAATEEIAFNLRTNLTTAINVIGQNSRVAVRSVYTADATPTPVLGIELAHELQRGDVQGVAATALWARATLDYNPDIKPIIIGPGSLLVYWAGTAAVTAFASAVWAELPSNVLL